MDLGLGLLEDVKVLIFVGELRFTSENDHLIIVDDGWGVVVSLARDVSTYNRVSPTIKWVIPLLLDCVEDDDIIEIIAIVILSSKHY